MAKIIKSRKIRRPNRKNRFRKGLRYGRKKEVVLLAKQLNEHFPPAVRTRLRVVCPFTLSAAAGAPLVDGNAQVAVFRGNGIIACGPAIGNTTGSSLMAYATNYPAGINYLLGTQSVSNLASAPYTRYLVIKSWITIRFAPNRIMAAAPATTVMRAVLIPFAGDPQGGGITMQIGNMEEQPYAVHRLVPIFINTQNGIRMKNSISTMKIQGINKYLTTDDTSYTGTASADAALPFSWIFGINNLDGTATQPTNVAGDAIITYDVIFFARNILKSVAPS